MHLKAARASGKLAQFIKEHGKSYPHTRKYRFRTVVRRMALNTPKGKRGSAFAEATARQGAEG